MNHDDVIKWKHFPRYWPFVRGIHRSSVNSPHKGQWRGALMFSLICACINGCVNNHGACDLRCPHTHYDVTVMSNENCQLQCIACIIIMLLYPMTNITHWGMNKNGCHFANDILKCIFGNEKYEFWLRFLKIIFLRVQLVICQHWFRCWLGAKQALSPC